MSEKYLKKELLGLKQLFHGDQVEKRMETDGTFHDEVIDFSTNVNPLGPPLKVLDAIKNNLEKISDYPQHQPKKLREALADYSGFSPENIVVGNGANELIHLIARSTVSSGDEVLIVEPTFTEYSKASRVQGASVKSVPLKAEHDFKFRTSDLIEKLSSETELLFLCSPNNPTGNTISESDLRKVVETCSDFETLVVLDEAFHEYCDTVCYDNIIEDFDNLISLRSLTKIYSLPGLRIGYAIAQGSLAESLRNVQVRWNVNSLAQVAAEEAVKCSDFLAQTRERIPKERESFLEKLKEFNLKAYPSEANFLLLDLSPSRLNSSTLSKNLFQNGIAVRQCDDFEFLSESYIRVSVRPKEDYEQLLNSLESIEGIKK